MICPPMRNAGEACSRRPFCPASSLRGNAMLLGDIPRRPYETRIRVRRRTRAWRLAAALLQPRQHALARLAALEIGDAEQTAEPPHQIGLVIVQPAVGIDHFPQHLDELDLV